MELWRMPGCIGSMLEGRMKARRSTIFRQGLLVIALPLLYQTALIVILMLREEEQIAAQKAALRTKDIIEQTDRVFRILLEAQADLRGFVITGEPVFEQDAARELSGLPEEMRDARAARRQGSRAAAALRSHRHEGGRAAYFPQFRFCKSPRRQTRRSGRGGHDARGKAAHGRSRSEHRGIPSRGGKS